MDHRDFVSEIAKAWRSLHRTLGLGRYIVSAVSLDVDDEFKRVSLDPTATYAKIYRTGLSRSNYNIMLQDYAYFQFTWIGKTHWRLCYYPNPWISGVPSAEQQQREWEALEELGTLTFEEVSELLSDMPYWAAIPPIRFEYVARDYREFVHPAAHFHIGTRDDNRWPSAMVLGPMTFSLLIAKLYYPEFWMRVSKFYGATVESCIDQKYAAEVSACAAAPHFSDGERRLLHFGKNMRSEEPRDWATRLAAQRSRRPASRRSGKG